MPGSPYTGKTTLAARLATLYGLTLLDARALAKIAAGLPGEAGDAARQELSGKAGRASDKSLAAALRHAVRALVFPGGREVALAGMC
jgi:hypothetical protein